MFRELFVREEGILFGKLISTELKKAIIQRIVYQHPQGQLKSKAIEFDEFILAVN